MNNVEYRVKRENPNDEFAIVGAWKVKSGERVAAGAMICNLEATKNNYDVSASAEGHVHYQAAEGDRVNVGDLLFVITDDADFVFAAAKKASSGAGGKITRKARKLMDAHGIDASVFADATERVMEADVQAYIDQNRLQPAASSAEGEDGSYTDEKPSATKAFEIYYMSKMRDVIYSHVVRQIPFSLVEGILAEHDGTTLGEVVATATIPAVRQYPYVNACYIGDRIRKYESYNLGLAINVGMGLKTPVIREFDQLDLGQVSYRFKEVTMRYVRDELEGADMAGGTFTITDLSSLGVHDFSPIVNTGQCAILGVCAVARAVEAFNLVLGFDHRVIDGMYAAEFLAAVEQGIEDIGARGGD